MTSGGLAVKQNKNQNHMNCGTSMPKRNRNKQSVNSGNLFPTLTDLCNWYAPF